MPVLQLPQKLYQSREFAIYKSAEKLTLLLALKVLQIQIFSPLNYGESDTVIYLVSFLDTSPVFTKPILG